MFISPFHIFTSPFYVADEKLIEREKRKSPNATKPAKKKKRAADKSAKNEFIQKKEDDKKENGEC